MKLELRVTFKDDSYSVYITDQLVYGFDHFTFFVFNDDGAIDKTVSLYYDDIFSFIVYPKGLI